jgi:hypothetical protein
MPRHHGSRVQTRPLTITHQCAWPPCVTGIQTSQILCPPDWQKLPIHLRNAWQDARQSGSAETVDLARSAIAAYARRNPGGRNSS